MSAIATGVTAAGVAAGAVTFVATASVAHWSTGRKPLLLTRSTVAMPSAAAAPASTATLAPFGTVGVLLLALTPC